MVALADDPAVGLERNGKIRKKEFFKMEFVRLGEFIRLDVKEEGQA